MKCCILYYTFVDSFEGHHLLWTAPTGVTETVENKTSDGVVGHYFNLFRK